LALAQCLKNRLRNVRLSPSDPSALAENSDPAWYLQPSGRREANDRTSTPP
jgi:hypothetical protein